MRGSSQKREDKFNPENVIRGNLHSQPQLYKARNSKSGLNIMKEFFFSIINYYIILIIKIGHQNCQNYLHNNTNKIVQINLPI